MKISSLIVAAWFLGSAVSTATAERKDKFIGNLVLADFEGSNYRNYKLVEDLQYVDPRGRAWNAQHGLITDGASIPPFLWSIVGSPYTGHYRRAAIIHDYYCTNNFREWNSVETAFYDAMITDGVSKAKALLMYYAVVRFGPKWSIEEIKTCPENTLCAKPGDLDTTYLKRVIPSADEEALKKEVQTVADELAQKPTVDRVAVEKIANARPPLAHIDEHRRISDNWLDFRWRHSY